MKESSHMRVARVISNQIGDPTRYATLLIGLRAKFPTEAELEDFVPEIISMWQLLTGRELTPEVRAQLSGEPNTH